MVDGSSRSGRAYGAAATTMAKVAASQLQGVVALADPEEAGVDTVLLKAKSRQTSFRSLERYVHPSEQAVARMTATHDRERRSVRR